jgi:hypothetical protein
MVFSNQDKLKFIITSFFHSKYIGRKIHVPMEYFWFSFLLVPNVHPKTLSSVPPPPSISSPQSEAPDSTLIDNNSR